MSTVHTLCLLAIGVLLALLSGPLASARAHADAPQRDGSRILLETDHLVYVIGRDGLNRAFQDRRTGKDHLDTTDPGHFMAVQKDGQWIGSTAVELARGFLYVTFGDSGIRAKVHVRTLPGYLTLELTAVNDHTITSLQLAHLPLTLTQHISYSLASCRDDEYAAAVIPLNIETHAYPVRGPRPILIGHADQAVRLEGARIAILGCPADLLLDRIEQVEIENGLPHSTLGGVWARRSPEQMKSYLFVDLSEATSDEMIDYARTGGFGYIVVYDGVWNGSHGTYPVNRANFPGGETGLKAVSDKIHAAGLKFGMHNLDMVVAKTDTLVHPVPDPGFLMYPDRRRILAGDIGPEDTFIPTTTSPDGLLTKADKSRFHGRDLRIGDEIIVYDDLQTTEPYGFTGCTRGAHETLAAAHTVGTAIDNFSEFIGFYRPDVKSDLYDRIARAEAEALDRFEFDYIYPDGIGENLGYWPEGPPWYISNLLVSKLYHYTRREVMFAHGPVSNYSWHVFSRGNTTDFVQAGVIKHFDRVSVANSASSIADLQPFEFGWFGYFTHSLAGDATRPREMEYAWCKALAYGAAMSLETTKAALDANGRTREIFARIRNWEELKLNGHFPERIHEQLKIPGQEFVLDQTPDGAWEVLPIIYGPEHYVAKVDESENVWTFHNPYPDQPLSVFIDAKPHLTEYGDTSNTILLEPGPLNLYTEGSGPLGRPNRQTDGLEYEIGVSPESSPAGEKAFEVTAVNNGSNVGWGCVEIILDTPQNLTQHRALGTWVEGDGSGTYLHFVLEDAGRWCVRDFYVHLDFTGWKYINIPEPARGEVYDFAYPYNNYWAIRQINFGAIARIYVFLSDVPAGAAAKARFSRLEALQETPQPIHHPELIVNGELIVFPVVLPPNGYLEYEGSGPIRVFDANGFTVTEADPEGTVPTLRKGDNRVMFRCDSSQDAGETVKVTPVVRGEPVR